MRKARLPVCPRSPGLAARPAPTVRGCVNDSLIRASVSSRDASNSGSRWRAAGTGAALADDAELFAVAYDLGNRS